MGALRAAARTIRAELRDDPPLDGHGSIGSTRARRAGAEAAGRAAGGAARVENPGAGCRAVGAGAGHRQRGDRVPLRGISEAAAGVGRADAAAGAPPDPGRVPVRDDPWPVAGDGAAAG